MKKIIVYINIIFISLFLFSCESLSDGVFIGDKKKEVVEEKYGEVEYITEGILIYKNLKVEFNHIEGLSYIIKNGASSGSAIPEVRQNLFLTMDIVKHDDKYKLLVYNTMMKKEANEENMFVMTNYFLPVYIQSFLPVIENNQLDQDIKDFNVMVVKKGIENNHNFVNKDEVSLAFYNKSQELDMIASFYDPDTGNVIVSRNSSHYEFVFANVKSKEVYYPVDMDYGDLINENQDTLNGDKISFSLNNGLTFQNIDNTLEEFDIYKEQINSEVRNVLFFYAFEYSEFLNKIEDAKTKEYLVYELSDRVDLDELVEIYDEEYFEENILLFYYKFEPNISDNYVYSVTRIDDRLVLNVNRFEGMLTAISFWNELITIKKEDIIGVNSVDLVVRTVSSLQSSVVAYVTSDYIRDFFLNPITKETFSDLDNLEDIRVFRYSLNVDLIFNKPIDDEGLERVLAYLEENENIKSVGYIGKDKVRMQMEPRFYDEVVNKTLKLRDFFNDIDLINEFSLSIEILNFAAIGYVEFYLTNKGRANAYKMIEELYSGKYVYFRSDLIYGE